MLNGGERIRQHTAEEREQLRGLQSEYNQVREGLDREISQSQQDANNRLADIGREHSTADQRAEQAHNRVLGRQDALHARNQQLDDISRQLRLAWDNAARSFDLANFMNEHAIRELRHDMIQAGLELYCENQAAGQEAVASFFRASLIMMKAEMGASAGGRLSSEFNPNRYFQLREPAQNESPEYYARARNEEGNYLSQLQRYEDRAADTDDLERLAEARTEAQNYREEARQAREQRDAARAEIEDVNERRAEESARLSRLQARMQEIRDRPFEDGPIEEE